jgi:uncharacterized protein YbjT (DUF2867 family)
MILIVGATGLLGGMITRRLLDRGEHVRILVRTDSSFESMVQAGAEAAFGDLKDPDSLDRAMLGADRVITTANSAGRGGPDNVETVEIAGNRNLIDAARKAGVEQFIFTSALGADEDSPVPFLRGKALTERYLRESGVPYTILSPNLFMEVWIQMIVGAPVRAGRPVTLVGEGRRRHAFVSASDVADFAVAAVGNPAAINQQIVIGGPVALSWREILSTTEQLVGRSIPIQSIPVGSPLPGLPQTVADLASSLEMYDSPIEMVDTAATYGVTLTPVETFLGRSFS